MTTERTTTVAGARTQFGIQNTYGFATIGNSNEPRTFPSQKAASDFLIRAGWDGPDMGFEIVPMPENPQLHSRGRLFVEDVKAGDVLQWTNGLGGIEEATVFESKITGKLAINIGIRYTETSVWGLLRIDNGCRIVSTEEQRRELSGFAIGDHLVLTYRMRRGTERRNAQVSSINYNGNGLVTFSGRSDGQGSLESGQGAFDPKTVGDKPYGLVKVEKTGGHSAPWKPFCPKPGDRAFDLMC